MLQTPSPRISAIFRISLALFLLLLGSRPLRADGSFERKVTTSEHPDLYVSSPAGSVRIFPGGNGQEIQIRAQVHATNGHAGSDVQARIDSLLRNPPITQSGDTVHIGEIADRNLLKNIVIEYQVSVPFHTALNLHTGSGDIEIDHVGRFLAASSGSGSIRAHGLHGPAQMETGSGDIELEEDAIRGPGYTATACQATNSGVEEHNGRYSVQTTTACHLPAGDIQTRTGSGSIRLHGLEGKVRAITGSGDIEVDGLVLGGECHTGSGSVRLHVDDGAKFDLDASTGSGTVRVHLPGLDAGAQDSHAFRGGVDGGGARLVLHSGSGDIEVTRHS